MDCWAGTPSELLLPPAKHPEGESKGRQLGIGRNLPKRCRRCRKEQLHEPRYLGWPLGRHLEKVRRQLDVSEQRNFLYPLRQLHVLSFARAVHRLGCS